MDEVRERFDAWLDTKTEGWWDDCCDAGAILDVMEECFRAGWDARTESAPASAG